MSRRQPLTEKDPLTPIFGHTRDQGHQPRVIRRQFRSQYRILDIPLDLILGHLQHAFLHSAVFHIDREKSFRGLPGALVVVEKELAVSERLTLAGGKGESCKVRDDPAVEIGKTVRKPIDDVINSQTNLGVRMK